MKKILPTALAFMTIVLSGCHQQAVTESLNAVQPDQCVEYKSVMYAEIPCTWSYIRFSEFSLVQPGNVLRLEGNSPLSISQGGIFFQELTNEQINVYAIAGKDLIKKIQDLRGEGDADLENTIIDGREAIILKLPTEPDGSISKAMPGGKAYHIAWQADGRDMGLIISGIARGDESFEKGFQHFIQSFDLDKYTERTSFNYPKIDKPT